MTVVTTLWTVPTSGAVTCRPANSRCLPPDEHQREGVDVGIGCDAA
jgi:hypothetical protein